MRAPGVVFRMIRTTCLARLFVLTSCLAVLGCTPNASTPKVKGPRESADRSFKPVNSAQADENKGSQPTAEPEASNETFQEMTARTGIQFSYANGRSAGEYAILESLGGGVGLIDYDQDGRIDVYFAGGGDLRNKTISTRKCGLFRNQGDWQFAEVTGPTNTSADRYFTHGVAVADFDSDGMADLAISGYGGVQLLQNMGDGTFAELPPLAGRVPVSWSSSLAWADLDSNGHVDLYVAHYVDWSWQNHPQCAGQGDVAREVCSPKEFSGVQDVIYFNDGQYPMRADTTAIGAESNGKGLGVAVCDVNADGWVDIYVANDTTDNFLYLNDGKGKFTESAVLAGVSGDDKGISNGSMGICILDVNLDTRPDILVTNFERELTALYRNDGEATFTYASRQVGLATSNGSLVGFGVASLDYNFDGYPDVAIANGHVSYASPYAPYRQLPLLLTNERGRFKTNSDVACFQQPRTGRGISVGDLDNDGAADLVFSNLEDPVNLFRAVSPTDHHWISVRVVGRQSNRDGIGAKLSLKSSEHELTRFVSGGGSYLSQSDYRQLFYLPKSRDRQSPEPARLRIDWPSRISETFELAWDGEHVLREGQGRASDR